MPEPLPGQVHDRPRVLQRRAAAIGDVERAGLVHLPDLEVGEVQLDRAGARRYVEVEVMLARDERAGPRRAFAVGADDGPRHVLDGRVQRASDLELALRQMLDADRLRANRALAQRAQPRLHMRLEERLSNHAVLRERLGRVVQAGPPRVATAP